MTLGSLQHNVAMISIRVTHRNHAQCISRATRRSLVWQHKGNRWQSTTAKEIAATFEDQFPTKQSEIPATCFVDSPTFPKPSLNSMRKRTTDDVDLTTTRPASLDTPSSPERAKYPNGVVPIGDRMKYLFKVGKAYLLFYKTGLKNVWSNSKQYRAIEKNLRRLRLNTVAKYGGQHLYDMQIPEISRSEYQLCIRTRHDLKKLIPFGLVFIICGEFTPLVIVALGSRIVPYTCRIPRQEQQDLEKGLKKDQQYMEYLARLQPKIDIPLETPDWQLEHMDAYRLGLTSFRNPVPVLGQIYHNLVTWRKLVRHCDNLVSDTILIHRQGGPRKLSHQDIFEWADAYGLYALRQYVRECQKTGQSPRTEKLKDALLPKVEAEMKYMLDQMANWNRLKYAEQWRVGLRTLGSQSPDWQARVDDIKKNSKQG